MEATARPGRVMYKSLGREASKCACCSSTSNLGLAEVHLGMLSLEFLQDL